MSEMRLYGTEAKGILTTAALHESHRNVHTINAGTAHLQQLRYVTGTGLWGSKPQNWPA